MTAPQRETTPTELSEDEMNATLEELDRRTSRVEKPSIAVERLRRISDLQTWKSPMDALNLSACPMRRLANLSGGEKRRVALCKTLAALQAGHSACSMNRPITWTPNPSHWLERQFLKRVQRRGHRRDARSLFPRQRRASGFWNSTAARAFRTKGNYSPAGWNRKPQRLAQIEEKQRRRPLGRRRIARRTRSGFAASPKGRTGQVASARLVALTSRLERRRIADAQRDRNG